MNVDKQEFPACVGLQVDQGAAQRPAYAPFGSGSSCDIGGPLWGRRASPINLNALTRLITRIILQALRSAAQRHRLLIEHRLDRLARCVDVEAVLLDQIAAIGQDGVGVVQHLQPLEMIVMMQPHAGADDFKKVHDAERPIALVRA
jgi:hypothetical protein